MQSSIKYRPRSLDELIGQQRLTKLLRGQYKKKILPNAMMFVGPKGSGKTSIARIVALSVQCRHQDKFGQPCLDCRRNKKSFPIYELNCGRVRGVDDVEQFIDRANFDIVGKGRKKTFIFDEAHRLSGHSQDVMLKPFEEPGNNLFIINTTRPEKIADTLRSRCQLYPLRTLNREQIAELVQSTLKRLKSKLSVDDLADSLVDRGIYSARLIQNACDKYVSGESAEDAAEVEGAATIDTKALCRATIKGDWPDVISILKKTTAGDVRLLRASIIAYLRSILFDSSDFNDANKGVAEAIKRLSYVGMAEDSNQLAALSAELYTLCNIFQQNSR